MATDDNFYKNIRYFGKKAGEAIRTGGEKLAQGIESAAPQAADAAKRVREGIRGTTARTAGEAARRGAQAVGEVAEGVAEAGREFKAGATGEGSVLDRTAAQRASENAARRAAANPELATEAGQRRIRNVQRIGSARTAPGTERVVGETAPSRFGQPQSGGQPPRSRFPRLRGAGRFIGRVAPPAAAAATLYEAGQFAGQSTEDVNREKGYGTGPNFVESGLRRIGVPENAARLGGDIASRYAGMIENLVPFGSEITSGGASLATGETPVVPSARAAPARPAQPGAPRINTNPNVLTGASGGQVTPANLIAGTDVPAPGQGAFQRTSGGSSIGRDSVTTGPGQAVGLRGGQVTAGPQQYVTAAQRDAALLSQADARTAPRPDVQPRLPGVFGEIAQGRALQQRHRQALREDIFADRTLDRGVRVRGQNAQIAATAGSLRKQATEAVNSRADQVARTRIDPARYKDDNAGYEAAVKDQAAKFKSRLNFTLGARNRDISSLSDAEFNQYQMADDMKHRIETDQSGFWSEVKDYFGQNRYTSRNLDNYLPVAFDGSTLYFRGGNSAPIAAIAGGEFNLFGPNSPIDVDTQSMIRGLPRPEELRGR